jgi:pimeloyl-ACP methyl ester carboxylesterase
VCLFLCFAIACGYSAVAEMLEIEVVDPNPALLLSEGKVIAANTVEAVDRLSSDLSRRSGVVADGVSSLLLRVRASNEVMFSVSPRLGTLRDLSEGAEDARWLTIAPRSASDGTSWAFVLYTAPDYLPGAAARRTSVISAHEGVRFGSTSLRLENPPVLLVHGLWSDSSTWDGLKDFLIRRGFPICEDVACTVNYGAIQPAPSFDPLADTPESQFAINHLIEATANILNTLRQEGIAATQVDVVAHSLGGLIARSRVVLPDPERAYRRRENFQRGDFHKLITIGTPHRGTPVADFLVANRAERSSLFGGTTLEEYLATMGYPVGAAIEQMQTFSPALMNLGATMGVPSHAIVGVAPANSHTERLLNSLPRALGFFFTLDDMLGGNGRHDTLVPRSSQAGGLSGAAVTFARGAVHADIDGRDIGETEARLIWRRVAQLLRAPAQSRSFSNFTALETNAVPLSSALPSARVAPILNIDTQGAGFYFPAANN